MGYDQIDMVGNLATDTNAVIGLSDLSDNSQHWLAIESRDMYGANAYSDTAIFWTDAYPEPPGNFASVYPEAEAEGLDPNIEFTWQPAIDPDPLDVVNYTLAYYSDLTDTSTYTAVEGLSDTSFTTTLSNNSEYWWFVEAIDGDSLITASDEGTPQRFVVGALSIDQLAGIPDQFALHQN